MIRWIHKIAVQDDAPIKPQIKLTSIEQNIFDFIRAVCKEIPRLSGGRARSPIARSAGGFVRDKLLGKESNDIDISIDNMTGLEFGQYINKYDAELHPNPEQRVASTFSPKRERDPSELILDETSGQKIQNPQTSFGSIYGQEIDLLNLRAGEEYEEGVHMLTGFRTGTPEEDAHRRDLTINSLFYNINTGEIEDYTGKGLSDLFHKDENGKPNIIIRTPLEPIQTFKDDPVRVMRVLRFYSKFENAQMHPSILEALDDPIVKAHLYRRIHDPKAKVGTAPEATGEEFSKIMQGAQPDKAIALMTDKGIFREIINLPKEFTGHLTPQETHRLNMNQRTPHHSLGLMDHTLRVLKHSNDLAKEYGLNNDERMLINFAALFHDIGKLDPKSHVAKPDGTRRYMGEGEGSIAHETSSAEQWDRFAKSINLTNDQRNAVADYIGGHMKPHSSVDAMNLNMATDEPGPTSRQRKHLNRYIRKNLKTYMGTNPAWAIHWILAQADAMSSHDMDPSSRQPYRRGMEMMHNLIQDLPEGEETLKKPVLEGGEIRSIMTEQFPELKLTDAPPKGSRLRIGYIGILQEWLNQVREERTAENPLTREEAISLITSPTWVNEIKLLYTPVSQKPVVPPRGKKPIDNDTIHRGNIPEYPVNQNFTNKEESNIV